MSLPSRWARPAIALCLLTGLAAQANAQAKAAADVSPGSKIDIYGGYAYWHPISADIANIPFSDVGNKNATVSISDYLFHNLGVQIEGSYLSSNKLQRSLVLNNVCRGTFCDQDRYTAQAGPIIRFPLGPFIPYFHALAGGSRMNGPALQNLDWGYGVTAGGGLDIVIPAFSKRFAIRPIQADYTYDHVDHGALAPPPPGGGILSNTTGGIAKVEAVKVSAGLVVRFGLNEHVTALVLGCSASPVTVYPGDTVSIISDTVGMNPKKKPTYTWAAKGGVITPTGSTATIDTTGLAPGQYDVVGHVSIGDKPTQNAFCSAPFNVRNYEPPTITCAASPTTAQPGTNIAVNCVGMSPQHRPLKYSYTSTAGQISGSGRQAVLATAGLQPMTITATGTVTDDIGQSASAPVRVRLTTPPPPPPPPSAKSLCTLSFKRDARRPGRVDNEAKGCLDDITLTLQRQADAKLVIVGNSSPEEKPQVAAERALNARSYLTKEKGIDPARISVRVGDTSGRTAVTTLVPAGATFPEGQTQEFDEAGVALHGQAYPGAKPVVKRKKK